MDSFKFNNAGKTAEELQLYFEQLCALPDEVLQNLWENSEVRDRLQKISERLAVAHWEQFRDTIKCSKCGFGFFPNGAWFQNGECIENYNSDFRPNYCPHCGKRMLKE